MPKITVTYGEKVETVEAEAGSIIGDAIAATGLPLEQPCAGRGTCGKCKILVESGVAPPDEIESTYVARWDAGQRAVLGDTARWTPFDGVAVRIDEKYAYPHVAVGYKMEFVREEGDVIWLRGIPPEDPQSLYHRVWLQRQADELEELERIRTQIIADLVYFIHLSIAGPCEGT